MRAAPIGAALTALIALSGAQAGAEETRLIFATVSPPNFPTNVLVHHPWAERVNEQGKGVLQLDVRDGPSIANQGNFYARVVNDVVQVSWGLQGLLGGLFPRTEVAAMPFVPETSRNRSVALYRLYKSGLLDAEYEEIVPLALVAFPHNGVHTAKPLKTAGDITGAKLIVTSKLVGQAITRLGATPMTIPLLETYESLQRGTVDGVITAWTAVEPLKLQEVTTYHVDTELGGGTGILLMAKKRYAALPDAARAVLDANSGEGHTGTFGAFWDGEQAKGRALVTTPPGGHTIVSLTPEQDARWRGLAAPVAEEWAKNTPKGVEILARYRALVADVKAGR